MLWFNGRNQRNSLTFGFECLLVRVRGALRVEEHVETDIHDKKALILGASGGMGAAVASELACLVTASPCSRTCGSSGPKSASSILAL